MFNKQGGESPRESLMGGGSNIVVGPRCITRGGSSFHKGRGFSMVENGSSGPCSMGTILNLTPLVMAVPHPNPWPRP